VIAYGGAPINRHQAVANYYRTGIFNVVSFTFLAGNIVILYALRFGAGTVVIGLIAASYQFYLMFTLLGRYIVPKIGAVKTYGFGWIARYVFMVPLLLTQISSLRSNPTAVVIISVICAFGFNVAKGIGLAGTRPILGELAPPGERGKVISTYQLIFNVGGIIAGIVAAATLGADAPLSRYGILMSIGIFAGILASYFILRLPEPQDAALGYHAPLLEGIRIAAGFPPFRRFVGAVFTAGFSTAMVYAFLIVFFKEVYGFSDGSVAFFAVAGPVGGSVMALVNRSVSDRIGSKSLIFAYSGIILLVCVALGFAPPLKHVFRFVFPPAVFFLYVMGHLGVLTSNLVYFYTVAAAENRLNLGIVASLSGGVAGLLGGTLGGLFLSALKRQHPLGSSLPFSIYFGVAGVVMIVALVQIFRMSDAGAPSMRQSLAMIRSGTASRDGE